ncbi:CRISPR system Cascade subunit CasA [Rhodothalassium salexigens DSM 2132]|uniref:CRISPR system Cascade subunit CasA n=1 Tax=Rhodothalassium salexigens DSM 2132 TaxID=1188247 RepID=A0A4R2PNY2_RHOSA|nr:type I-E CRISPR-associated protein Cse1/CasA [Rhodothalassium salexigens]MBB4210854.1 CRISPR system Cascade subunit CasA [Rhodothalassium salexigens DSM 2132]MBK1639143.1 type I-E CRISPR-associated protein Cse1/CasA [Rhodothalassium salexigens DSM 2132]TCP36488.1 CRISPR system Cascade subunit CasA [Rhodothalassium salexigens DSM 2132]
MPFSLLDHPWIPVRRANGWTGLVRPDQLTDFLEQCESPIVALAAPRPDVNGALLEFLIGLVSTTCPPDGDDDWEPGWIAPPPPETLRAAFARHAQAFVLDGDGPRFLQDQEPLQGGETPVAALLIDAPGQQTQERNTDMFVRRGAVKTLSRPAAAWALLTLQTYAPSGGAGHMTSLRGGGPLTTVVSPPENDPGTATLWHLVWLNVESRTACDQRRTTDAPTDPAAVYPWLGATRVSGKQGARTAQSHADPRHVWFGMPRRIRLTFRPAEPSETCDLTGATDAIMVSGYVTRPYGFQYGEGGFQHPLTPHYRPKPNADWLPVHGGRQGIGYRDWLALTSNETDTARQPAACVTAARDRLADLGIYDGVRLRAFGYDMNKKKACGWVEAEMPLLLGRDDDARDRIDDAARSMVAGANLIAAATADAVEKGLFAKSKNARGDFSALDARVWRQTEPAFFKALGEAADPKSADTAPSHAIRTRFLAVLRETACAVFDEAVPVEGLELTDFRRIVNARRWLTGHFVSATKTGKKVHEALGLPVAPPGKPKTRKTKTAGITAGQMEAL